MPPSAVTKNDIENLTKAVEALAQKIDRLYVIIMVGEPEENKPSLLEIVRGHEAFISWWKRAAWIFLGAIITAIPVYLYVTAMHVSAAGK